jgi:hypothetical protein
MYVSFDAFLTTKILYTTLFSLYLVSVLQMLYAGAHPFWMDSRILSSYCLQAYNHPSMGVILMTFIPSYSYYVWTRKSGLKVKRKTPKRHVLVGIGMVCIFVLVQLVNYIVGIIYLMNVAMSLVVSALLLMVAIAANTIIDSLIKKSTVLKTQSKQTSFSWLLFICLLGALELVILSG